MKDDEFPGPWHYILAAIVISLWIVGVCIRNATRITTMTNAEKYSTANERHGAFAEWCGAISHDDCSLCELRAGRISLVDCVLRWLELESKEEKIEDCPYCGGECVLHDGSKIKQYRYGMNPYLYVECQNCGYRSRMTDDYEHDVVDRIVAAHNRVARGVISTRENELK